MALQEFWNNVRIGARMIAPQVVADSPQLDRDFIERKLRAATLWLTPARSRDSTRRISRSSPRKRVRVWPNLSRNSALSAKLGPTDPAPREVVESALPLFLEILQMLDFGRYGDAEAYRLGKQIEQKLQPEWPKEIAELRFKTGLDHTGDPGLWIWVFLTEEVSKNDDDFLKAAQRLRAVLDPIARRVDPDRWPYLSFRPITEPAEAVEAS